MPFQPVDGGLDRACLASGGGHGSRHYDLRMGVATIFDCELSCVGMGNCVGIAYRQDGRCELWRVSSQSLRGSNETVTLGSNTTVPEPGSTCLRIAGPYFDARLGNRLASRATPRID